MTKNFTCIRCGNHGWISYEPPLGKPVKGHCDKCLLDGQIISVEAQREANE